MKKLNLNYNINSAEVDPLENILKQYGEQISEYADGYLTYIVTTTHMEEALLSLGLYILAPAVNMDYNILTLDLINVKEVKICFFSYLSDQTDVKTAEYGKEKEDKYRQIEDTVHELLSSGLANTSLKFLEQKARYKKPSN